jgi:hypothetical protein
VAVRACHELAGISTLTLWVLAFERTSTPTLSSGSGNESVDNLTKNERADVWLRINMCTKGPEVLERGLAIILHEAPAKNSRTYFPLCETAKSRWEGGGGDDGVSLNIH